MTESDWLRSRDPSALLQFLEGKVGARPLRLLACACCRLAWDVLTEEGQEAVACVERFADGQVSMDELDTAVGRANEVVATYRQGTAAYVAALAIRNAGYLGAFDAWRAGLAVESAVEAVGLTRSPGGNYEIAPHLLAAAADTACALIRDVAGKVLTRSRLAQRVRNPTVRALARTAYAERAARSGELDPNRLAVLADALEESGCTNAAIVGHLRSAGPHTPGCWALDCVLGLK